MRLVDELFELGDITALERDVLNWLLEVGYDRAEYGFSAVSINEVSNGTGHPVNVLRGVISSLNQKGFTFHDDEDLEISGIYMIRAEDKLYMLDDDFEKNWKSDMEYHNNLVNEFSRYTRRMD